MPSLIQSTSLCQYYSTVSSFLWFCEPEVTGVSFCPSMFWKVKKFINCVFLFVCLTCKMRSSSFALLLNFKSILSFHSFSEMYFHFYFSIFLLLLYYFQGGILSILIMAFNCYAFSSYFCYYQVSKTLFFYLGFHVHSLPFYVKHLVPVILLM